MIQTATLAVGYVRMSTDDQENSPARQRMEISRFAESNGYTIIKWFEDHGLSGTEATNRKGFQDLMMHAKAGSFQAVILSELSRGSREEPIEALLHWRLLKNSGVKLVSVQKGGEYRFDDMGGLITLMIDQFGAHDESRKFAARSTSGKRKMLENGQWSVPPMFGFDREFSDSSGAVVARVNGYETFRKPVEWKTARKVTSDSKVVDAIQWAFENVASGVAGIATVASEWNERGVKTLRGADWSHTTVRNILTNPSMAGVLVVGKRSKGKFETVLPEGETKVLKHESVVSESLFQRVQVALKKKAQPRDKPARQYLLSGVMYCAECGEKMHGSASRLRDGSPNPRYICVRRPTRSQSCSNPSLNSVRIENAIIELIRDVVLSDENATEICRDVNTKPTSQNEKLNTLDSKITKATENLALAETPEDFRTLSKLIADWRKDRAKLVKSNQQFPARPKLTLSKFKELRQKIGNSNEASSVVLNCVDRIEISRTPIGKSFDWSGKVFFNPSAYGKPVVLKDVDIVKQSTWKRIRTALRQAGRSMSRKELVQKLEVTSELLARGEQAVIEYGVCEKAQKGDEVHYKLITHN